MRVCVILPAAGSGTRFGGDKLSQDLGGRPLLLRTVELFTKRDEVATILVAAPPDALDEFRMRFGAPLSFHGARVIAGGRAERWETVKLALDAVPEECTHVAIHDAARPAATTELLDRLFAAAALHDAVIPALPVTATLKRVAEERISASDDDGLASAILGDVGRERTTARHVTETIPRDGLVAVQTPQIFARALIKRAYDSVDLAGATDDAQIIERLGEPVLVIEGDSRNVKVTTPDDLMLVRAILGASEPAGRAVHKRF